MYKFLIMKPAKKFIDKLPENDKRRIVSAIEALPDSGDIKKLQELQGKSGYFRLRVGNYRIIYTVDHGKLIVYIVDAGNRGQIYNRY